MAKIIIVDERDNKIGVKEREEVGAGDICRTTGLWMTNSKGQILLAQRKMDKRYNPGCWGPAVAGTVEAGETYDSNIEKEVKEELGHDDIVFEKGPYFFVAGEPGRFVQYYIGRSELAAEDFHPQKEEVERVKWRDKADLARDLAANPGNYTPSVSHLLSLTS